MNLNDHIINKKMNKKIPVTETILYQNRYQDIILNTIHNNFISYHNNTILRHNRYKST